MYAHGLPVIHARAYDAINWVWLQNARCAIYPFAKSTASKYDSDVGYSVDFLS